MFNEIVQSIENSELFSIAGMLLFFAFFISIVYGVIRMDKKHVDRMSRLPMDNCAPDREEYHG